jgi:biotin synthase
MNENDIWSLAEKVRDGHEMTRQEAAELVELPNTSTAVILAGADNLRRAFKGLCVTGCLVVNVKSGRCSEDCSFCAQSAHNEAVIEAYPMVDSNEIVDAFGRAAECGTAACGIVTSGRGLSSETDVETVCEAIRRAVAEQPSVKPHASLGTLPLETLRRMKESGLHGYHHNLETSRSFFPEICTTHSYDERVDTVKAAKEAGLWTCSGGLFGLGETWTDRIDLAMTLRELDVDSVPINFLDPIPGTRLESTPRLEPLECLRIIALMRFMMPKADIRVCGGRERAMRELQAMMFYAGANGTMLGDYLTTTGRPAELDIQLIKDLGLELSTS